MLPKTLVVKASSNAKLGRMAATYRTQTSCPTSCPLMGNGCYAEGRSFFLANKHGRDDLAKLHALDLDETDAIRFNVSGDFLLADGQADLAYIGASNDLIERTGATGWSYTHGWRDLDPSMFNFVTNASCETKEDLEEAIARGWQAVVVDDGELTGTTVAGRRVVQCPAQTRGVTCADCKACASDKRTRPIISFAVHGIAKNKATRAVQEARA